MVNKDDFIKLIICEYRFSLNSWEELDEKEKQMWLAGMLKAWNLINPNNTIEESEIAQKHADWSSAEAQEWCKEYRSPSDKDPIESRFQILDLRLNDE